MNEFEQIFGIAADRGMATTPAFRCNTRGGITAIDWIQIFRCEIIHETERPVGTTLDSWINTAGECLTEKRCAALSAAEDQDMLLAEDGNTLRAVSENP